MAGETQATVPHEVLDEPCLVCGDLGRFPTGDTNCVDVK